MFREDRPDLSLNPTVRSRIPDTVFQTIRSISTRPVLALLVALPTSIPLHSIDFLTIDNHDQIATICRDSSKPSR